MESQQNIVTKKMQTLANVEEQHLAAMSTTSSSTKVTTKTTKKVSTKKKAALKTTISLSVEATTEAEMDALMIKANDQQQIAESLDKKSTTNSKVTKKKATSGTTVTSSSKQAAEETITTTKSTTITEESTLTSAEGTAAATVEKSPSPMSNSNNLEGAELNGKKKSKSKKSKKSDADKQNISVKSSFSKFDALQKRNLIHVRSSDAGKAQEKFSNPQGEKEINCRLCSKPVYKMEEIKAEKSIFHKNCFRCKECDKQLKVDNYQSHEGVLYCMVHFKLLFAPKCVEDTEPEKPRKHELIIRENQPIELPPDVVRASDKPDLGLEELQQLNVRSRFKVFENGVEQKSEEQTKTVSRNTGASTIKRSGSLLSKLAKLQSLGFSAGISEDDMAAEAADSSGSENDDDDENATSDMDEDDIDLVRSKKSTQRERPVGIGNAMNDIKTKFEKGHGMSKEERREERKQEIQNIRSRLFMGKQARIKEMYQQAVADSEQAITSVNKKPDVEIDGGAARSLKERFEKGDMFKDASRSDNEDEGNRTGCIRNEADIFESAISKKSRSIFMELDANVTAGKNQVPMKSPQPIAIQRNRSSVLNRYNSDSEQENMNNLQQQQEAADVVKCDEKADDVKIETADISQKFKFFETYRPSEGKRKQFRITPPRDGVVKMPTPESDAEDAEISDNDTIAIEKSHTTSMMLNKFREMEQNKSNGRNAGPKPLKCFTPPPDGGRRLYQQQGSQEDTETDGEEEEDDDDDDEEDFEEEEDQFNDVYRRSNMHANDEALLEAQAAARAKQLRAKFEKWEANEVQREMNEGRIDIYSDQVSDDTTIESTRSIRDRFENMKNSERKSPTRPRYQVNRFV